MTFINITSKFNTENLLCISIENQTNKNFTNIKLCFSLVYSIEHLQGASIHKQIGRYYELILDKNKLSSNETRTVTLKLQTPRIGSYNLSCGPEGIFILDEKEERIQIRTNSLFFDKPINKKKYDKIDLKVVNPIIPEPIKTNLINQLLILRM